MSFIEDGQFVTAYTVAERQEEGLEITTRVIIDGEILEFVINRLEAKRIREEFVGHDE